MSAAAATKTQKQASYLITESPLVVLPTLATVMGINKAIVIQQLHFLLNNQKTSKNTYTFVDGRWWVYNSYAEWRKDYFPWLSVSSIKAIFNDLEDEKLVVAKQSMKYKSDRRKWYTIDYDRWDKFCLMIGQNLSDEPSDKNCLMIGQNLSDGLSDNTSESTSISSESNHPPTPDDETQELIESKAAQERRGDGEGVVKAKHAKRQKERKPKASRPRDAVFDAIAVSLFRVDLSDPAQVEGHSGRVVALKSKLKTMYPTVPDERIAAKVEEFPAWYHAQPETRTANLPLGADTFGGYFSKFIHSLKAPATSAPPDPNCPTCHGVGFWIDKSDQYNHKKVICDCRKVGGLNNG